MPRDPPRYPRLVRRDRKKQPVCRLGQRPAAAVPHGIVNASSCSWFYCLPSLRQCRAD